MRKRQSKYFKRFKERQSGYVNDVVKDFREKNPSEKLKKLKEKDIYQFRNGSIKLRKIL